MSSGNAALGCQWFEQVWNQQRIDAIDELASPDCKAHGHAPGDEALGLPEFKEFFKAVTAAFPDVHVTVEETISEGNRSLFRWHARMTHRGPFMGAAPTNKKVEVRGMSLMYFEDSKIVEAWDNWDQLGLFTSIGVLPATAVMPHAKAS